MTQYQALKIMLAGNNIFLTGPPGSGKTFLLNKFIQETKRRGKSIAIAASSGIAATYLNGTTIHSWSGIGIKDSMSVKEILKVSENIRVINNYLLTDVLVIDEVSMLDSARLDLINDIAKTVRRKNVPMGGIQLVLVGDLFQLPPVTSRDKAYIFHSKVWSLLNLKICYLSEQHRQYQGDELNPILSAIRGNRVSQTELAVLQSKIKPRYLIKDNILRLYSHNFDANNLNNRQLDLLKTKEKTYKMRTKGDKSEISKLKKALLSPELIRLKKGSEVMFTANNYRSGYVNGDRGRVVGFRGGLPIIRMKRSAYIIVEPFRWQVEINSRVIAEAWQLPLKLAWAITIHKSQGMSLEEAVIDLSRAFSTGMGYVALSRLKSIDGLYLLGLNRMALYVDSEILKLDKTLRAESDRLVLR